MFGLGLLNLGMTKREDSVVPFFFLFPFFPFFNNDFLLEFGMLCFSPNLGR